MDEKMKSGGHVEGCKCGTCEGSMWGGCGCYGHGCRHTLVKVVILLVVFWLGMHVGEWRTYNRMGMMGGYPGGMMQGYSGGYDQGYGPYGPDTSVSPANPIPPTGQ